MNELNGNTGLEPVQAELLRRYDLLILKGPLRMFLELIKKEQHLAAAAVIDVVEESLVSFKEELTRLITGDEGFAVFLEDIAELESSVENLEENVATLASAQAGEDELNKAIVEKISDLQAQTQALSAAVDELIKHISVDLPNPSPGEDPSLPTEPSIESENKELPPQDTSMVK